MAPPKESQADAALESLIWSLVGEQGSQTPFQRFVTKVLEYHERPAFTLAEIRARESTKAKGDLFECFCVRYLKHVKKYDEVWRLADVPEEVLVPLGLGRRDVGIDLVARHQNRYVAVQCKFKKLGGNRHDCVNWKELSTFYALCARTQAKANWKAHLVMTNARSVRRMGDRTDEDKSICFGSLNNLSSIDFAAMLSNEKNTDQGGSVAALSLEELRAARLKALLSASAELAVDTTPT